MLTLLILDGGNQAVPTVTFNEFLSKPASFVAVGIVRPALYNSAGQATGSNGCAKDRRRRHGQRSLVLESAQFPQSGRRIRGGYGHTGSRNCHGRGGGRTGSAAVRGPAGRYTLSQALHHHSVL